MEEKVNLYASIYSNTNYSAFKLKLTKKSKQILALRTLIITLFSIFFAMNIIIYSKLESIELKLYNRKKYYFFSLIFQNNDLMLSKAFKTYVNNIINIIAGLNTLTVYNSIIYLTFHPFIGLKLVFVVNISHYCLILIKIILKAHRPFWDLTKEKIKEESICKNDYASPSIDLFFCCFFSLYSIISLKLLQKKKFSFSQKNIIFLLHFFFVGVLIIISGIALDEYLHQLIFTIILGFVLICLLLEFDKRIHNSIFKTLKNVYYTRIYKMKIFFYIMGTIILTIISLYFIDEDDLNNIKLKVKNINSCNEENLKNFGIKKSFNDLSYIFGVVGAFWGASFTVEKNIGKWWGGVSKRIFIIKVLSIIIVNTIFILLKYYLPYLFKNYEFNFILGGLLNFFQYFCSFGIIPLFLQHMELIERKKLKKNEGSVKKSIRDEEDNNVILFRTSIFKDEKQKGDDEGFVVLDKEVIKRNNIKEAKKKEEKEENKIQNEEENEHLNKSDFENEEKEIIYNKKKEEEEVIYSPSPLVENVHKLEDEGEYNLALEGMDDNEEKDDIQEELNKK